MKTFVISLKSSITRREKISKELKGIDFVFFDAEDVSDREHEIYSLYKKEKTQLFKGYTLTRPELGCFASHIALWRYCVELDEPILILEDNIHLLEELVPHLKSLLPLTHTYGVIKLANFFTRKFKVIDTIDNNHQLISNLKGACGTSAYSISPRAAQTFLAHIEGFFEPVDDFMDNEWRTKQTIYSYQPLLVERSQTQSTIGSRKDKTQQSKKQKVFSELYRSYKQVRQALYNLKK